MDKYNNCIQCNHIINDLTNDIQEKEFIIKRLEKELKEKNIIIDDLEKIKTINENIIKGYEGKIDIIEFNLE